jgi:hypothetical protein
MDDLYTAEHRTCLRKGGLNFVTLSNQVKRVDRRVFCDRLECAVDDHSTPVITTHHIHRNSHKLDVERQ